MRKSSFLTISLICCITFWSSCSKSDHSDHGCHPCHIAMDNPDYDVNDPLSGPHHFMWHIEDENGEEIEFCDADLELMESENWTYTIPAGQFLIEEITKDTLHAGTYSAADGYECHCDDHVEE